MFQNLYFMAKVPRLRYFARFKEDIGYLRATLRYNKATWYLTPRFPITRDQAKRFDTSGILTEDTGSDSDFALSGRMAHYKRFALEVANALIAEGTITEYSSEQLNNVIRDGFKGMGDKAVSEAVSRQLAKIESDWTFDPNQGGKQIALLKGFRFVMDGKEVTPEQGIRAWREQEQKQQARRARKGGKV